MRRINGFQLPMSSDQTKTLLCYPITLAGYFLLLNFSLIENEYLKYILVYLNVGLTLIILTSWFLAELINPEHVLYGKQGLPLICLSTDDIPVKYCGTCRKSVLGLDHHCTWLNTCIGRRNYLPFLVLVFVGAGQQLLQFVIGLYCVTSWIFLRSTNDEGHSSAHTRFGKY